MIRSYTDRFCAPPTILAQAARVRRGSGLDMPVPSEVYSKIRPQCSSTWPRRSRKPVGPSVTPYTLPPCLDVGSASLPVAACHPLQWDAPRPPAVVRVAKRLSRRAGTSARMGPAPWTTDFAMLFGCGAPCFADGEIAQVVALFMLPVPLP